jgi:hypothetical protein
VANFDSPFGKGGSWEICLSGRDGFGVGERRIILGRWINERAKNLPWPLFSKEGGKAKRLLCGK